MSSYVVKSIEEVGLIASEPLSGMAVLSPYIWCEDNIYKVMVRAVNASPDPTQQTGRIYYGESRNGLMFTMLDGASIVPGTNSFNKDGCEDPTVLRIDGEYLVYYTGWNMTTHTGQLLLAEGPTVETLATTRVALADGVPYRNPKEATFVQMRDGAWCLFFEYAADDRSHIGLAVGDGPKGPWHIKGEFLDARPGAWDRYHMSTGPVLIMDNAPTVMFYNGSDEQARWRIGWVEIDDDEMVLDRSEGFLIAPPEGSAGPDIAFAASCLEVDGQIWLYYSLGDAAIYRAIIERRGGPESTEA